MLYLHFKYVYLHKPKMLVKSEGKFIWFWSLNLWVCVPLTYVSVKRKHYRLFLDCYNQHPQNEDDLWLPAATWLPTQGSLRVPDNQTLAFPGWFLGLFILSSFSLLLSPLLIMRSKDWGHWWLILKLWTLL